MSHARETIGRRAREAPATVRQRLEARDSRRGDGAQASDGRLPALHWMTAALFAVMGADAAAEPRAGARHDPVRLAPLVAAPLAGAAHAARALSAAPRLRLAARLLDALAAGMAVTAAARIAYGALAAGGPQARAISRLTGALLPLTLGATAMLGLVLEHEEEREGRELRRLRRRARLVERLVPRRRARLDRIVLHV